MRIFTSGLKGDSAQVETSIEINGAMVKSQNTCVRNNSLTMDTLDISDCKGQASIKCVLKEAEQVVAQESLTLEIVDSGCRSTGMIDGAWVDIIHWSDFEGQKFNDALRGATDADWADQIRATHAVGINTVVIQNLFHVNEYVTKHKMTFETYRGEGFYNSKLFPARYETGAVDPIGTILTTADELGMKVFMGIGLFAWFDFTPESLKWHLAVTDEVFQLYGHHPSLYGWYISEEIMAEFLNDPEYYYHGHVADVIKFFASYQDFVRKLSPCIPVLFAPNNFGFERYLDDWEQVLKYIDILAPFGFARNPVKNIDTIQELCDKTETHMWVDMELFKYPFPEGLIPKPFEDIQKEIDDYHNVEFIVGYEYTGILNSPESRLKLGGKEPERLYQSCKTFYEGVISSDFVVPITARHSLSREA